MNVWTKIQHCVCRVTGPSLLSVWLRSKFSSEHDDLPQPKTLRPLSISVTAIKLTPVHSALLSSEDESLNCPFVLKIIVLTLLFTAPIFRVLSLALKGSRILTVCALTQAESQYPLSVCIKDTVSRPVEGLAAGQWACAWRRQRQHGTDTRREKTKGKGQGYVNDVKAGCPEEEVHTHASEHTLNVSFHNVVFTSEPQLEASTAAEAEHSTLSLTATSPFICASFH